MGDFLADIAERSFTTAQAIRPRPLSVFEPFQATGNMGSAQQSRLEQDYRLPESDNVGTASLTPATIATREQPATRREANTISVQGPNMGVSAAIADPQPVAPTIVVQPASQGEFRPAEIQPPPDHTPLIEPKVQVDGRIIPAFKIRSDPPVKSPGGRQTAIPSGSPVKEGRIDSRDRESVVPDHQSKVIGTISEVTPLKPAIERVEMENSVAAQLPRQPIAPLHSRLETKWRGKNEPMQKEGSTPTINVTIGRIEVRATPAPIQKQPKSRATDAMSLDEYMRRRNGDGR